MAKKRKKQERKDAALSFESVFDFRGRGPFEKMEFFDNTNPIILELGCGVGVYTNELALKNRDTNYIGIDKKAERIWRAAKNSQQRKNINTRFIIGDIDLLDQWVGPKSISEIWITFPDPHPREKMAKKRLTSPKFLGVYKQILKNGGVVHLKTDDEDLFNYTIDMMLQNQGKIISAIANVYQNKNILQELTYKTLFEKKWLEQGKEIFYCKMEIN